MDSTCSPARARASAGAIVRSVLLVLTGLACLLSVAIGSPDRAYPRRIATAAPAAATSPAALVDDVQTDATGLLTSLLLGNGIRLQRSFDPNGLLIAQSGSPSGAGPSLGFDANGNVLSRTLFGRTTHYAYDPLDRLIAESGPAGTRSYTYDANGNRLSDGTQVVGCASGSNRLATIDGQPVPLDAAGNSLQLRGLQFTWDEAGRLSRVSRGGALLARYAYDHSGLRVRKQTTEAAPQGAGIVHYHHDGDGRLIAETTGTGLPLRSYIWVHGLPVVMLEHQGAHTRALYLETDQLGSPIAATDAQQRLVWKWESDAFGTTAPDEDPDGDGHRTVINLRFAGQYFDAESGLHQNWFRYYAPWLGRYISADPIGLDGGDNLFAYADGNPLRYSDEHGLAGKGPKPRPDRLQPMPLPGGGGRLLQSGKIAPIPFPPPVGWGAKGAEPSCAPAASLPGVPGRVSSRINLSNEGMSHVIARHLSGKTNASQFTLSESELRSILTSQAAVDSLVLRSLESAAGIRFVREFDAGRSIGVDRFNNNQATSIMTIVTDRHGNLVSTFPGRIE